METWGMLSELFVKLYFVTKMWDINIAELNLTEHSKMDGKRDW